MIDENPNILIVVDDPGVPEVLETTLNAHVYFSHGAEDRKTTKGDSPR